MSLIKLRQLLAKGEELKELLIDSDPKRDGFELVNSLSSLLTPYSVLLKYFINNQQWNYYTILKMLNHTFFLFSFIYIWLLLG